MIGTNQIRQLNNIVGRSGKDMKAQIAPRCNTGAYEFAQSQLASENRQAQFAMAGVKSCLL